jgi:hypothetical protein
MSLFEFLEERQDGVLGVGHSQEYLIVGVILAQKTLQTLPGRIFQAFHGLEDGDPRLRLPIRGR